MIILMKIRYMILKQVHDFKVFKIIGSFVDYIYSYKIDIHEANQEQADLLGMF